MASVASLLFGLALLGGAAAAGPPRADTAAGDELALRRALKESTLRAAELEIAGYLQREKTAREGVGPAGNAERFHQSAEELKARASALRAADLSEYPPPTAEPQAVPVFPEEEGYGPVIPARKVILHVEAEGPCTPGALLDVEGTSRSGPFFRVAGGATDRLKPGRTQQVIGYLVFRREYFAPMADYYVHIAEVK